jgi:hypothetical protein
MWKAGGMVRKAIPGAICTTIPAADRTKLAMVTLRTAISVQFSPRTSNATRQIDLLLNQFSPGRRDLEVSIEATPLLSECIPCGSTSSQPYAE